MLFYNKSDHTLTDNYFYYLAMLDGEIYSTICRFCLIKRSDSSLVNNFYNKPLIRDANKNLIISAIRNKTTILYACLSACIKIFTTSSVIVGARANGEKLVSKLEKLSKSRCRIIWPYQILTTFKALTLINSVSQNHISLFFFYI